MKNLYGRIGLRSRSDDPAAIKHAIDTSTASADDKEAASFILLNAERKHAYDRAHAVMCRIGQLRTRMGLVDTSHWTDSMSADYAAPRSTRMTPVSPPAPVARNTTAGWVLMVLLVIGVLSCTGWIGWLILDQKLRESDTSVTERDQPQVDRRRVQAQLAEERRRRSIETFVRARLSNATESQIATGVSRIQDVRTSDTPLTGVMSIETGRQRVAPLEIRTRGESDYFVKVVDWSTKQPALTAFVRGGDPFETLMPLGSYEIRYATGKSWFGPELAFGPQGGYARCEDRFDFTENSSGYSGYTIELFLQTGGNLETTEIPPEAF